MMGVSRLARSLSPHLLLTTTRPKLELETVRKEVSYRPFISHLAPSTITRQPERKRWFGNAQGDSDRKEKSSLYGDSQPPSRDSSALVDDARLGGGLAWFGSSGKHP